MSNIFTNNARGALASGIASGATSITLGTGQGALFANPSSPDYSVATIFQYGTGGEINHEIVRITARSGDTLTVTRGQEGTTARAFNAGDPIQCRVTAAAMNAPNPESVLYGRRAGYETLFNQGNSGSAVTIPFNSYQMVRVTLNAAAPALTLPIVGVLIGYYTLIIVQDATGSRVPSFVNVASNRWGGDAAQPPINPNASGVTVLNFLWTGTEWIGSVLPVGVV